MNTTNRQREMLRRLYENASKVDPESINLDDYGDKLHAFLPALLNDIERLEDALRSIVEDWEFCREHGGLGNRSEAYYVTARDALARPPEEE